MKAVFSSRIKQYKISLKLILIITDKRT